jgi:hypothetical protein
MKATIRELKALESRLDAAAGRFEHAEMPREQRALDRAADAVLAIRERLEALECCQGE